MGGGTAGADVVRVVVVGVVQDGKASAWSRAAERAAGVGAPRGSRSCGRKTGGGPRWMWAPLELRWASSAEVLPEEAGRVVLGAGFGEGRALPNVSVLLASGRCAPFLASLVSQQTKALGSERRGHGRDGPVS